MTSDDTDSGYRIVSENVLFTGPRFQLLDLQEEGPDGRVWPRQVVRHPGAAVVLPILDDGRVVLVRQYRTSLGRELLELPAGILDPGEEPATAAVRELAEETGYQAARCEHLLSFCAAPGITDEIMHVFRATGLRPGPSSPDEDERVEVELHTVEALMEMARKGQLEDSKTLLGLLYGQAAGVLGSRGDRK
ncbi:MAG: NUDIX hydrolase [Planctomycetota bacterium]